MRRVMVPARALRRGTLCVLQEDCGGQLVEVRAQLVTRDFDRPSGLIYLVWGLSEEREREVLMAPEELVEVAD